MLLKFWGFEKPTCDRGPYPWEEKDEFSVTSLMCSNLMEETMVCGFGDHGDKRNLTCIGNFNSISFHSEGLKD